MKTLRVALWLAALGSPSLCAQDSTMMAKDAKPTFEVATIRPTLPDEKSQGFQTRGHHVKLVRETVKSMIMLAYGVHGQQIVDAPEWMSSVSFDVDGIPDSLGAPNFQQLQMLVRSLLTDRFGLKFHKDSRDLSYYALKVASGGAKIAKSSSPEDAAPDSTGNGDSKGQTMKFTNNTMPEFLVTMQYFLDRPLVNETGLPGKYDFTLRWSPDDRTASEPDAAPALFTAARDQLGLEFRRAKGPVDVLVIDQLTKPSEN